MNDYTSQQPQPDPEYPPAIILSNAGDTAEGVIERWSSGPSKFNPNEDTPIAVLRQSDGTLGSCWLNATVLKSKFARLRPQIGERVVIELLGVREGASASYKDFRVDVPDREPYVPNWDSMDTGEDWGSA